MATPFFSVDLDRNDWQQYFGGILDRAESAVAARTILVDSLSKRFPYHYVTLLPSARMGFFLTLQHLFREGDELIFSSMSFPLYVKIALQLKLVPVLVDVDPIHLNIDTDLIQKAITPKTRGIVATHLFGHPCQMDQLTDISQQTGIPLIEDCAQSFDSFFDNQETGTFGLVGIFSTSLMKVPTTLGGGILITKSKSIYDSIIKNTDLVLDRISPRVNLAYHMKGFVSMLNSYPWVYTILSHQIFGLLKRSNPSLLRAILYSGMGLGNTLYRCNERPPLTSYQYRVGKAQLDKSRQMTLSRRLNSASLNEAIDNLTPNIVPIEGANIFWNYQYHVLKLSNPSEMDRIYDLMFNKGIHVMKEDVWDCTKYNFADLHYSECGVCASRNPGLLRIPNNSKLSKPLISTIGRYLVESLART